MEKRVRSLDKITREVRGGGSALVVDPLIPVPCP